MKRIQIVKTSMPYPREQMFNPFGEYHRLVHVKRREVDAAAPAEDLSKAPVQEVWYLERDPQKCAGAPYELTGAELDLVLKRAFFFTADKRETDIMVPNEMPKLPE